MPTPGCAGGHRGSSCWLGRETRGEGMVWEMTDVCRQGGAEDFSSNPCWPLAEPRTQLRNHRASQESQKPSPQGEALTSFSEVPAIGHAWCRVLSSPWGIGQTGWRPVLMAAGLWGKSQALDGATQIDCQLCTLPFSLLPLLKPAPLSGIALPLPLPIQSRAHPERGRTSGGWVGGGLTWP